jgi:D-aminopeptidase
VNEQLKPLAQRIGEIFAPFGRSDAPGLVLGVARGNNIVFRQGFGLASIEHGLANGPTTRMRIGSTSKQFTCLATLLLAEDGMLDVDASVRAYLPELPTLEGEPTLRQLMTHTGGHRCYLDLGFIADGMAIKPVGEVLAVQSRQTSVNFRPGDGMLYNNGGYHLLSIVVDRVAGMPFERFLEERIFAPLGMVDTQSIPSDFEIHRGLATLHVAQPGGGFCRGIFPSLENRGDGGTVSTVDDMLIWLAHLRGTKRIGNESTWRQMLTKTRLGNGQELEYCLGLVRSDYRGIECIHHGGSVIGGTCQMLTAPSHDVDVILITNGAAAHPGELVHRVIDAVLDDEELAQPPEKLDVAGYESLLGRYAAAKSGLIFDLGNAGGKVGLGVLTNAPLGMHKVGEELQLLFSDSGMGPYRIEIPSAMNAAPVESLVFRDCGEVDRLDRIGEDPDAGELMSAIVGDYFCADLDTTGSLSLSESKLELDIDGHFGGNHLSLKPISGDVFEFVMYISSFPLKGTLNVQRSNGTVASFTLNTPRTRNLLFTRTRP